MRRRYSDNEKAEALAALDANGGNVLQTARQLSIPHKTLDEWAKGRHVPEVATLRNEKTGDLHEALEELAYKLVGRLVSGAETAQFKDAAIALGIAVDKMQLLAGKPTAITHDASLSESERITRVAALLDRARARGNGLAVDDGPAGLDNVLRVNDRLSA